MTEPLAPPAGPPPGWEPEPRPRRRRRWVWVLVGVLAAITALFGVGVGLFVARDKPVIDAANAFLDDIESGRFDDAYEGLCEDDQDEVSAQDFARFAAELRNELVDPSVNFLGVDINGDRASVDVDPDSSDTSDVEASFELELRKEGGDWKVCELFNALS